MNDGNKQKLNGHKRGRFNDEFRLGAQPNCPVLPAYIF